MKQIGLLGLCFGILISGVRGQEVLQQNVFTGFTNISVGENEVCEIFNIIGQAYVKPLDYAVPQEVLDIPDEWTFNNYIGGTNQKYEAFENYFNSSPKILIDYLLLNQQKPVVFGPCKIVTTPPWANYGADKPGTGTCIYVPNPLFQSVYFQMHLITYRILPKQGYSPSITPTSLASNTNFVSGLTQTILSNSNSYGLATRTQLIQALAESRADGINSVLSNPNLWTLYTTNQIHAMAIGDLVFTSTNGGQFVLNYDIEQSEDLVNWTPYQGFAMPLTNLPTNKAFVRIKAKQ